MTEDEKKQLYWAGRYTCPPPPVPHILWDEAAWIRYIDIYGTWNKEGTR